MKVAYLDLSLICYEDYSILPSRYGGGRIIASEMKEFDFFHIFALPTCFENVDSEENKKNCHPITEEQKARLLNGEEVTAVIPELASFDILFHCHTHLWFNTPEPIKQVIWSVGYQETIEPRHTDIFVYNDYQFPIFKGTPKFHRIQLGKRIPQFFVRREKEDYIFQCTRHVQEFSSIDVAIFCNLHGIKGIFAGPIGGGYPLLNHIDNKNTFYIGQISEKEKLAHTKKAKLYTFLHNWPTPFNLSAIEALSFGTSVACTTLGFWTSLVKDGVNGFHCFNDQGLQNAWQMRDTIKQEDCYISSLKYNHYNMINSVIQALENVHKK